MLKIYFTTSTSNNYTSRASNHCSKWACAKVLLNVLFQVNSFLLSFVHPNQWDIFVLVDENISSISDLSDNAFSEPWLKRVKNRRCLLKVLEHHRIRTESIRLGLNNTIGCRQCQRYWSSTVFRLIRLPFELSVCLVKPRQRPFTRQLHVTR